MPTAPANNRNSRAQLQALLDDKEKQLRLEGILGQRFLAQQLELEERVSQLNDLEAAKTSVTDGEVAENKIRDKLQELKETMKSWELENQDMFDALGNKANEVPPFLLDTPLRSLYPENAYIVAEPTFGPTFSDGPSDWQIVDSLDPVSSAASPSANLRAQLQVLLDNKEKQLRLTGTFGQRFLVQQVELEGRINRLNDLEVEKTSAMDEEAVESEIRDMLQELKETTNSWESENQDMFGVLGNKANGVPPFPPGTPLPSLGSETLIVASPTLGPSAAQSSRRAINTAHRSNDVEFAFEIGSGLLTEVRRLQSLLAEQDKTIQVLKEDKYDLEKLVENLKTGLRTQEARNEAYGYEV